MTRKYKIDIEYDGKWKGRRREKAGVRLGRNREASRRADSPQLESERRGSLRNLKIWNKRRRRRRNNNSFKVQQGEFNTERKTAPRKCIIITVLNMKLVL